MSIINETTTDALQEIIDELTQIEFNVGAVNQAVANINANMINYQRALDNINEQYYNIDNIIPPPIYEYIDDEEELTIMDGILAEEEARRDEAARIIQGAWVTHKLYE